MFSITELLTEHTTFAALTVDSKTEALDTLIGSLKISDDQRQAVKEAIYERERIVSTGIGQGIAIPHCKVETIDKDHAAFAVLDQPVSFESIDEEPVKYIFLLASPKGNDRKHLKLLSQISRMLNNDKFRSKLKQENSDGIILQTFNQHEAKYYS